jgi:hypothetical protein
MSSSVLYERLRDLAEAGLVGKDEHDAYGLTELGRSLHSAIAPLDRWAQTWATSVRRRGRGLPAASTAGDHGSAMAARCVCGPPARRSADHARR